MEIMVTFKNVKKNTYIFALFPSWHMFKQQASNDWILEETVFISSRISFAIFALFAAEAVAATKLLKIVSSDEPVNESIVEWVHVPW